MLVCLLLLAGTLIVYAPAFRNGFVDFDDGGYVFENPRVLSGLTMDNARWALTTTHAANWHPLTWWSLQFDSTLSPPSASGTVNPRIYHATNVALHAGSTVLLFLVFWRMTWSVWRSAFVAAFFALHPLHVESVAWISERKDVLCGFFWMLTLLAYVYYAERPGIARYLLIVGALALALLAKPMAVTLPFVLLLLDYWPLKRLSVQRVVEKLPLFALSALSCVATWYAQHRGGAVADLTRFSLEVRIANALLSYVGYITKMLRPVDLSAFYAHPGTGLASWQVVGAGLLLTAVTGAVIVFRRRWPYLPVGWFWYLGTLVPVIGLVQVGSQAMADRYTYLPLIGLFLLATWGVADIAQRWQLKRFAIPLAGVLLAIASLYSWAQVCTWQDSIALWKHAIELNPDNPVANKNLGVALFHENKVEEAQHRFEEAVRRFPEAAWAHDNLAGVYMRQQRSAEAIPHLLRALELRPDNPFAHTNLGTIYAEQGKLEEAIHEFAEAARVARPDVPLLLQWAAALEKHGDRDEAIQRFTEALALDPRAPDAQRRLGALLAERGDLNEAMEHYREAQKLATNDPLLCYQVGHLLLQQEQWKQALAYLSQAAELDRRRDPNHSVAIRRCLAFTLSRLGQKDDARQQYQEASKINPGWLEEANANARTLATSPEPHARNGRLALEMARQVCEATDDKEAKFLDTLAAAYAETGQFDQAVRVAKEAVKQALASGQAELAKEIEGRIALYTRGQPYRSR
jgi:tetratricopeptide (TPR) repeat protein